MSFHQFCRLFRKALSKVIYTACISSLREGNDCPSVQRGPRVTVDRGSIGQSGVTWDPSPKKPLPHVAHTSIGKQAAGLQLKGFLVQFSFACLERVREAW